MLEFYRVYWQSSSYISGSEYAMNMNFESVRETTLQ